MVVVLEEEIQPPDIVLLMVDLVVEHVDRMVVEMLVRALLGKEILEEIVVVKAVLKEQEEAVVPVVLVILVVLQVQEMVALAFMFLT
tara:strand:+ start:118 stop:378 length:261 start_codon:yes stop_codon:yes gene_type:complete